MGLIFAKLWSFFCNQEHKVIIVGLDNAGKTTILYQFLMNEVVHTSPTIGSNVEEIVVKNTHFLMWDIGGQESLRSSWNTYYSNTEFIIFVVDSIDRERLSITKEELYRMLAHEDLRKAAVLIFANKQDMKGCMTAAEISKYLTLSSIKDHPWHIQSCCALTGEGEKLFSVQTTALNHLVDLKNLVCFRQDLMSWCLIAHMVVCFIILYTFYIKG
uniref:ARF like GTPase 5B n=1 Tax=Salvator merianae TaxID=96440 RepID=A0A8D0CDD5_SALMN